MERFPEKLKQARKATGLSQAELAERIGVSSRSFTDYECGRAVPRMSKIQKIANELGVTVLYLTNDTIDDPGFGHTTEQKLMESGQAYGAGVMEELSELIQRNTAFLAGGETPQEVKDKFFEAMVAAYMTCKREADRRGTAENR